MQTFKMTTRRKFSPLWNHFEEMEHRKAKCVYCSKILARSSNSIGTLGRHMKKIHPNINISDNHDKKSSPEQLPRLYTNLESRCKTSNGKPGEPLCLTDVEDIITVTEPDKLITVTEVKTLSDPLNSCDQEGENVLWSTDKISLHSDDEEHESINWSTDENGLKVQIMKREHLERERRANEIHELEIEVLREKLREAKALANLAENRLNEE